VSLGAVNNNDRFGYHLISYDGSIQQIDFDNLDDVRDMGAENDRVFGAQNNRLADHGIFPAKTMAGKAGGLIVACHASEAEKILDVVFGVPALERAPQKAEITAPEKTGLYDLRAMMKGDFGVAAMAAGAMRSLTPAFAVATQGNDAFRPLRPAYGHGGAQLAMAA